MARRNEQPSPTVEVIGRLMVTDRFPPFFPHGSRAADGGDKPPIAESATARQVSAVLRQLAHSRRMTVLGVMRTLAGTVGCPPAASKTVALALLRDLASLGLVQCHGRDGSPIRGGKDLRGITDVVPTRAGLAVVARDQGKS